MLSFAFTDTSVEVRHLHEGGDRRLRGSTNTGSRDGRHNEKQKLTVGRQKRNRRKE